MRLHLGEKVLVLAAAFALIAGASLMAATADDPVAVGKVAAYEAGKHISVEVGKEKKDFKITADTKVEGEVAVGKDVQVWAKDGAATRIAAKK